ncbi:MAG: TIGR03936 family radical SAM-associated protein, partial [Candidatus Margulisiibacteriota bacterium]
MYYTLIIFQKIGDMIYLGHLDFQNLWERLIRILELPICYSEGFHKTMKYNLVQPLGLGIEGNHEYLHLTLQQPIESSDLMRNLTRILPEGLVVKKIVATRFNAKWFHRHKHSAVYQIDLNKPLPENFISAIPSILSQQYLSPKQLEIHVVNSPTQQTNVRNLFSGQPTLDIMKL